MLRARMRAARFCARMLAAMDKCFNDPAWMANAEREWWESVTAAQQRLIARGDPDAFDLLAIARESLGSTGA